MRRAGLAGLLLILAGCETPGAHQVHEDEAACVGYGFKAGTVEMAQCRMLLAEQRDAITRAFLLRRLPR